MPTITSFEILGIVASFVVVYNLRTDQLDAAMSGARPSIVWTAVACRSMASSMSLALLYSIFAVVAIVVNIGSQDLVVRSYDGPFRLVVSLAVGTGAGLVVKYVLDKRYIFNQEMQGLSDEARTFYLYTLMGVVTTGIFWSLEFAFDRLFGSLMMRYAGGILGLCLGYYVKYRLDKRYVFTQ